MGFRNRKKMEMKVKILDADSRSPQIARTLDQLEVPVPKLVWFIRSAPALLLSPSPLFPAAILRWNW